MRRTPLSSLKMFEPIAWHGFYGPHHYITHLLKELGRLGIDIHDLGRRSDGGCVLSDLLSWLDDRGNEAKLYDWQNLNLELLLRRASGQYNRVKPRIDIRAHITARDNLSVVWYPTGWRQSYWDAGRRREMSDFLIFSDDGPMFGRPANELMFIHGITNLRPEHGMEYYGPYLQYNKPVVDASLICAVRAAYEGLIERLEDTFEVTVETVFVFEERGHQIISWSLEDPKVLQQRKDQAEVASIETNFGFTIEVFDEQLRIASMPRQGSEEAPSWYSINQKLARNLTKIGHKITPTRVEHLHSLINRCRMERT